MRVLFQVLILWFCLSGAVTAQVSLGTTETSTSEVTVPEDLSADEARALLSTLSDTQVRQLLLDRLDAVAEAKAAATENNGQSFADIALTSVGRSVSVAVERLPIVGTTLVEAWGSFREIIGVGGLTFMVLTMTMAIGLALLIEMLFRRLVRSWVESINISSEDPSLQETLGFLGKRLTADIVAVLIFLLAANTIGPILGRSLGPFMLEDHAQGQKVAEFIQPFWGYMIVLPRFFAAVGRFLLAPHRPQFRIVHATDQDAKVLFRHQIGFGLLIGLTFWLPGFLVQTGGDWGASRLGFWLTLSVHLYAMFIAWRHRDAFSNMMRGPEPDVTPGEAWAARMYPYFIIVATALTWWVVEILAGYGMFDLLRTMPHIWTITLISFAPAMDTALRGLVRHLVPPMSGEGPLAERAYLATRRSYVRIGRVIVFALVLSAIAFVWQIDLTNLAAASVGTRLAGHAIEMIMILAIGYLLYEIVSLWINRKLAAEMTAAGVDPNDEEIGGGEGGGAGGSRLSTVLPLVLATSRVTIVVVFLLLALGNVGVDTTPLLAGAGIVGLAVGFGAQKLVTDVVSGIFFLIDDAFRTGEYVEVDGTMGSVEKISIRSMQLRHHKGPVHTIPYGEIPKLTNYSRDWVIMKLRFTVPFDTDPNKVKKIFKKIGQEMLEVPEFAEDFLQPFKSQGVFEIDDVGMVIRGKFMAKPGKQFTLRKEIYNRVKAAFTENGIEFARREVRVALPSMEGREDLTEEDKASISAAATQAAQEMAEQTGAAPKPGD